MGLIELIFLAVGLSMDAFAVSVCKGLAMPRAGLKNCAICGLWFGSFQALMPIAGLLLGARLEKHVESFAAWIAFALLTLIGSDMIREAFSKKRERTSAALDLTTMFLMAVTTSIDAFAVGVTFACVPVRIIPAGVLANTFLGASIIGAITFAISCIGVRTGNLFGTRYKSKAEWTGGVILVLIGVKIAVGHLLGLG